jgi:hypothetical protein
MDNCDFATLELVIPSALIFFLCFEFQKMSLESERNHPPPNLGLLSDFLRGT